MGKKIQIAERLEKYGLWVVGGIAAAISLLLTTISLLHTCTVKDIDDGEGVSSIVYNIKEWNESVIYLNDNFFLNILMLCLLVVACCLLIRKVKNAKYSVLFVFIWTFLVGTAWVLSSQSAPTFDSNYVASAAREFAENDFSSLEKNRYFMDYAFQLGYVLFNELLFRLFSLFHKPETFLFLEVLNALFLAVINAFLVLINQRLFKDDRITFLTSLLLAVSVAPMIACSFVYGIYPGMMFAVIAFYCEIRWLQDSKWVFGILAAVCIAIAVMMKSNYMIWLIAMVLVAGVMLFRRRKYLLDCIFLVLAVGLSMVIQPAVKRMYEVRSGVDLGDSIPYISWIAMGLNESPLAPGWYSSSYTVGNFESSGYQVDVASERSKDVIKERLNYFIENPQYVDDFFYLKIVSQWNETSYQSIWNNVVRGQYKDKTTIAKWVCGDGEGAAIKYMDYVAQLVFFGFFLGCILILKRRQFLYVPMPLVFLGGFFYHLISEGKSQYIMPYFIVMTAFAAVGIIGLHDAYLKPFAEGYRLSLVPPQDTPAEQVSAGKSGGLKKQRSKKGEKHARS